MPHEFVTELLVKVVVLVCRIQPKLRYSEAATLAFQKYIYKKRSMDVLKNKQKNFISSFGLTIEIEFRLTLDDCTEYDITNRKAYVTLKEKCKKEVDIKKMFTSVELASLS